MSELKSCPFCGGEVGHVRKLDGFHSFSCLDCGLDARFPEDMSSFEFPDAEVKWNTRVERTCKPIMQLKGEFEMFIASCSECEEFLSGSTYEEAAIAALPNYCPHCGAKVMEE